MTTPISAPATSSSTGSRSRGTTPSPTSSTPIRGGSTRNHLEDDLTVPAASAHWSNFLRAASRDASQPKRAVAMSVPLTERTTHFQAVAKKYEAAIVDAFQVARK